MQLNKNTINIKKLVQDIKESEQAYRQEKWTEYNKERGMGRQLSSYFFPTDYAKHVTGLYTLRALLRGKMHRQNPPEDIRQRNVHYGRPEDHGWDMEEHNTKLAEKAAGPYVVEPASEPEADTQAAAAV